MSKEASAVTAVYPGSFDPITFGHVDIIRRVAPSFEKLVVLVAHSRVKNYLFSAEERVELIKKSLLDIRGVEVDLFHGLTVEYCRSRGAQVIVRGLRAVADFEHERAMAQMNQQLEPSVETFITFSRPEFGHIASRMVKEVAFFGGDISQMVPSPVAEALSLKFSNQKT